METGAVPPHRTRNGGSPRRRTCCIFPCFTTEDSLELHLHSSRAVIAAALRVLSAQPGCRLAEPGEFTRRALLSGRIDLTQAEGLADLINAETEAQRKGAMRVAEGSSRRRFESIRNEIIRCRTLAEALIDFGEGEEIEDGVWTQLVEQTTGLVTLIRSHLDDNRRGEILRSGVKLAIFGAPNAGKSSLLNYLAARPAAIVTPIAGTTRDVLEVSLDIGGIPVRVSDTAGLRYLLDRDSESDTVEQIGIERAKKAVEEADVRLCVISLEELSSVGINNEVSALLTPDTAILLNKIDKVEPEDLEKSRSIFPNRHVWIGSVTNDVGMTPFVEGIAQLLKEKFESSDMDEEPLITHARHRIHMQAAVQYLEASLTYGPEELVFVAEELRYASQELGKVVDEFAIFVGCLRKWVYALLSWSIKFLWTTTVDTADLLLIVNRFVLTIFLCTRSLTMFCTMRLLVAYVLFFLVFGQLCLAAPTVTIPTAVEVVHRAESVIVNHPVTIQNVPVAQLGVSYAFQLDPKTFVVADSDSGAMLKTPPTVTWERNSDSPAWLKFDSDKLIFSGTPDAIPNLPIRLQLVAMASETSGQNHTAFDLYISDAPTPKVISTLESQQNQELIRLKNASYLTLSTGVWIHPGTAFSVQLRAFCDRSTENSALYYSAYHPSNTTIDPLPQWLKFDNNTLTFSGVTPIEPSATDVVLRCSNVFGAGGPEQRMKIEVAEYMLELDSPVLPFQFTPGVMFTYNFHWLWHQLYLDGKFFAQAFSHMRFSNDSSNVPGLDVENSDDIGISFKLDEYSWLSFDRTNQTIYGIPPITQVLPIFPPIPLNITCRGREINAEIYVTSLAASAWVQSARPAAISLRPGIPFTYDFTLELFESVASNPNWDVFVRFDDPFDETSWLKFDPITRVISGTAPINSPPRDITALATSNAWGFNTTTSYIITIDNPGYTPPAPKFVWNQTTIALLISLIIVVLFLAMTICICCGLREGCLVSYPTLVTYYRGSRPSSQTLVDTNSEFVVGCCGGLEAGNKGDEIQAHTEKEAETHTAPIAAPEHRDTSVSTRTAQPPLATEVAPANASDPLPIPPTVQDQSDAAEPRAKSVKKYGLGRHLVFLKKRVLFGKGGMKHTSNQKIVAIPSNTNPNNTAFIPMWNGHIYQTPELLAAEERNWKMRRQERKARLKREYFAHKQAENTGVETRTDAPEEKQNAFHPDAPRRFGIFEQLAAMEDLDRKGPANMRGESVPRSRLVEVGENRFFDDTMLDRSEVGSSEFSSLASWETLSESSLPNMVLCYGQLGRRKMKEGVSPHGIPSGVDLPIQPMNCTQELPGPTEDTSTDEIIIDRIAHSLGPKDDLNREHSSVPKNEIREPLKEIDNDNNGSTVVTYSPIKRKGKGVARGEHGSPTSQHSPTFKMLAHQRFRASVDSKLGSPMSRARALTYTSPSARSIGSVVSRAGVNVSPTISLADVVRVGSSGMQFYFVPAKTKFCFKVQPIEAVSKVKGKQKSKLVKDVLYEAEVDGHFNTEMPVWLHFNSSTLEFSGQAPDTRELLQYSMRVVSRPANKIVCQLLMAVARPPLLAVAQASLGSPTGGLDTPGASPCRRSPGLLYSPHNSRGFGSPLHSSRSIMSKFGSNLSMSSVVFHFNQDGVEVFVVPATTNFCFEVPIAKVDGVSKSTGLAFGRAGASPYSIQLEQCDVDTMPHWLHFVPSSMEFWGEAPNVDDRLHVVMRIIHKRSNEVVGRIAIVITHMDDVAQLQAYFGYSRSNDGLSVVEEVSSILSDDPQDGIILTGPETPKRPQNPVPTSSSYAPSSWRVISPGSRRSLAYTSPSRRNLGLGTPGNRSNRRLRMKTPMSARQTGGEDYDSVMFEGHSYYSESLCGPELSTLPGRAIPNAALDAVSRAASREGSVHLSSDKSIFIVPSMMNNVEYYVIPPGVDFRFLIGLPIVKTISRSGCDPEYDVQVEPEAKDGWKVPHWLHARIDEELHAIEVVGSTHDVEQHEEYTLIVCYAENDEEVKRARVVVALDVNA
ncbi:tRNA modification GTPase MnmE [Rickettsia bellii OSU 85-389] [Rhizoctonia solani]|uniref:tRNA modification GTPase MnmE [Rickettsia bellii OSU 85-389] n=1 Tax=Rhizoctonia solani TaxID=456999 RepID=A0A0K6FVI3_9AGAM|nr:tRNA modification GTPase MnmE [Rickettsia bellii OSU 85-389] [Rhizoctonia solani]